MKCDKECNNCTYDDDMINLCLDKETRELLLNLIKSTIEQEFSTYEFLFEKKVDKGLIEFVSNSSKMAMDCLLPNREEK